MKKEDDRRGESYTKRIKINIKFRESYIKKYLSYKGKSMGESIVQIICQYRKKDLKVRDSS